MVSAFVFLQLTLQQVVAEGEKCPDMCKCPDETVAICRGNNKSSINVSRGDFCTHLKELDFSGNNVGSLTNEMFTVWNVPNLQSLNMSSNNIMDIETYTFQGLNHLQELDLSTNNISSMDEVVFGTNPNLTFLVLGNNQLTEINVTTFRELILLQRLDLSNNKIASIQQDMFDNNTHLQWLSLADNRLTKVDPSTFHKQRNLSYLDLSGNGIRQIEKGTFRENTKLESLLLAHNSISELDSWAFHAENEISHLNVSGNKIDKLENLTFCNLECLSISKNLLRRLHPRSFSNCKELRTLSLSGNFISEISEEAFYGLEKLEYLDLSDNSITNISLYILQGTVPHMEVEVSKSECISNIKHLQLTDNKIQYFNFTELIPLNNSYNISIKFCNLEVLDLNKNCLSGLDEESVNVLRESTDLIQLSDNPWSCECSDSSDGIYETLSGNRTLNCETRERTKERSCSDVELTCFNVISTPGTVAYADSENPKPGTKSEPKPFRATIVIFEIYVILVLVAIVVVLIITRAVGKPESDDCWWEDKLAKRNYY
jgi:Leucine-rich repeat (LRR) protein